jgi:lipoteichoic acid synthase
MGKTYLLTREGDIFGNYLQSLSYVDGAVGNLIDRLKAEKLWDETVLIIYGDHDSGIPFDDQKAAAIGYDQNELEVLKAKYEVPLFVHIPGAEDFHGEYVENIGMIDVAPSLLISLV